jgi:DNA-binding transcriptional MocR family regulator
MVIIWYGFIGVIGGKIMDFKIDRNDKRPLYVQIRDYLYALIKNEELKDGDRLPSVVGFAKEFGVTQATINKALEELSEQGWITSHVGRGTFVSKPKEIADRDSSGIRNNVNSFTVAPNNQDFIHAARRLRMGVAQSLESLDTLLRKPGLIKLFSGVPDPSIAQSGILEKMTSDAFQKYGQDIYQGYAPPMGLPGLREVIAERYRRKGITVHPDQVIITSGSQQAVSVISQEALDNKRRVICETPSYRGIFNAFGAVGHWVETLPRDAGGPVLSNLDRFRDQKPSVVYLVPELHNPMGTDISHERALKIADWVRENNSYLLIDEIFKDLRFEGKTPESLFSIAGCENTVLISSLSKSFMCGLRVGWMISSRERIQSIVSLKRAIDISCPPLMQGIALSLLETGEYDNHLQRAKQHYRIRRDTALNALERFMPDCIKWTTPPGGFHMWCELPQGYSSIALYLMAVNKGVAIMPGPKFDLDHRFVNSFNIGYGSLNVEEIQEGVELLADAVKELLKQPPADAGLSGLGGIL